MAYAHQGWLTEDHAYFYMNDEGDEASGLVEGTRTIIWDVQDLEAVAVRAQVEDQALHTLFLEAFQRLADLARRLDAYE